MNKDSYEKATGMERLRACVAAFNNCTESFLDQYTATELLALHRAMSHSDFDILPDRWHPRQVNHALRFGRPPEWTECGEPIHPVTKGVMT